MLLMVVGLQVPVIPLVDVPGNVGAGEPEQKSGIAANVGVTFGVTVISSVVVVAHCPTAGVKV